MTLPLTIACGAYDRTQAFFNGRVPIEGCSPNFLSLSPEEIFYRAFMGREFDVAELSFSTYLVQTARGECQYVGIPAFVSRSFRHSAFYVRSDRIRAPSDLAAARIGVPEYQMTAAVWARGILADEYGVHPRDIKWVTGGMEELGRHEKAPLKLASDIRVEMAPSPLAQMLADGEIDAILAPRAPSCFVNGAPHVARLFEDYRAVEADYFRKTGIFPIMHLIGIKKSIVAENPWLPGSILKAFEQARRAALPPLHDTTALHVSLPWLVAEAEWTRSLMGDEPWPYGVEPNRKTLDALLRYHFDQGLSDRRMTIADIFADGTYDNFRI